MSERSTKISDFIKKQIQPGVCLDQNLLWKKEASSPYYWNPENEIKIPVIDAFHKIMFEASVSIEMMVEAKERNNFALKLENLLNLIEWHFEEEESFLKRHKYPTVKPARDCHQEFLAWLLTRSYTTWLLSRSHTDNVDFNELNLEKIQYIKTWVVDHIFDFDLLYANWLKENGFLDEK